MWALLTKIFWWFILSGTLFTLSVFKAPELADSIGNTFWFPELTAQIRDLKLWFDEMTTNLPSKEELEQKYAETKSWALKLKDGIIWWIESTKEKVDDVRETLSWAEQKIEEAKDAYNKTVDFIDETGKKIEQVKETIENTSKVIEEVQNMGTQTTTTN